MAPAGGLRQLLKVHFREFHLTGMGRGCVKTQENFADQKIGFSKRPPCNFLEIGKGVPTHEFLSDLRFYTASVDRGQLATGRNRPKPDISLGTSPIPNLLPQVHFAPTLCRLSCAADLSVFQGLYLFDRDNGLPSRQKRVQPIRDIKNDNSIYPNIY